MTNTFKKQTFFSASGLALSCLLMAITGCGDQGPKYYPVEGKVIFKQDQSPARFGSVEFRSQSDPPVIARGKIQPDGTFKLKSGGKQGTVQGTHSVVIIQIVGDPRIPGRVVHDHGLDVATKYSDYQTSDLSIDVQPEMSKLVLEVDAR